MYGEYEDPLDVDSRHFTYCFNLFVVMQIFNFLNARKIDDSLNTLSNIHHSPIFIGVVVLIAILQFLIVTFGSVAFKVTIFVSHSGYNYLGFRTNRMGNLRGFWTLRTCSQFYYKLHS